MKFLEKNDLSNNHQKIDNLEVLNLELESQYKKLFEESFWFIKNFEYSKEFFLREIKFTDRYLRNYTRKLYVSSPKIHLEDFDKLSLYQQFKELLFIKWSNLERIKSSWWNCHYWNFFVIKLLEELKKHNNLEIKYELIHLNPANSRHSILRFSINNDRYLFDSSNWKLNINPIKSWIEFSIWSWRIWYQKWWEFFEQMWREWIKINVKKIESKQNFLKYLNYSYTNYFLIETNPWAFFSFLLKDKNNAIYLVFTKWEHTDFQIIPKLQKIEWSNEKILRGLIKKTKLNLWENKEKIIKFILNKAQDWLFNKFFNNTPVEEYPFIDY